MVTFFFLRKFVIPKFLGSSYSLGSPDEGTEHLLGTRPNVNTQSTMKPLHFLPHFLADNTSNPKSDVPATYNHTWYQRSKCIHTRCRAPNAGWPKKFLVLKFCFLFFSLFVPSRFLGSENTFIRLAERAATEGPPTPLISRLAGLSPPLLGADESDDTRWMNVWLRLSGCRRGRTSSKGTWTHTHTPKPARSMYVCVHSSSLAGWCGSAVRSAEAVLQRRLTRCRRFGSMSSRLNQQ